ncbi:hypothetical protein [Streptomyces sp. NPDC051561]|uniref:hypothetical protein n=1 Tax=Streptomyces sp. NPDC051561 TaxID=3365658 RepID=UPI00379FF775
MGALALVVGAGFLPWNFAHGVTLISILTALVLATVNALPRPRLHPAWVWGCAVLLNLVLLFVFQGFGLLSSLAGLPHYQLFNALVLGTGAWLLWWRIPVAGTRAR